MTRVFRPATLMIGVGQAESEDRTLPVHAVSNTLKPLSPAWRNGHSRPDVVASGVEAIA